MFESLAAWLAFGNGPSGRADPCELSVIFFTVLEQQRGEAVDYWTLPVPEAAGSSLACIYCLLPMTRETDKGLFYRTGRLAKGQLP